LQEHGKLPRTSLRTNIPVSLRTESDSDLSNKVTNVTVTLATDIDDPAERLVEIHRESEEAKAQAHSGTMGVVELFQMMPPVLVSILMGSLKADRAPQMLGANLVVSNIRGSPLPMYIAGARMEKMYPMSILTAGMGINITCISYMDDMDYGIIVDPELVPRYDVITAGLQAALAEYLALCKPPRTKRKAAVKAKRKSGQRKARPKKPGARKKVTPKQG